MNEEIEYFEFKVDFFNNVLGITNNCTDFPKYTTQLINLANQNAQGTRPNVVGQLSELIQNLPEKSYSGWRKWYLSDHPNTIDLATEKIHDMILKMKEAMNKIDKTMIREWVDDLVINKTAEGLIIQEIILDLLAKIRNVNWRLATPEEESKNIDGIVGDEPISIKPYSYFSKISSKIENIDARIIFYKKTAKYLTIFFPMEDRDNANYFANRN